MVAGRAFCAAFVLLAAVPAVSAQPLDDVNAPLCDTVWSYFCSNPLAIPR